MEKNKKENLIAKDIDSIDNGAENDVRLAELGTVDVNEVGKASDEKHHHHHHHHSSSGEHHHSGSGEHHHHHHSSSDGEHHHHHHSSSDSEHHHHHSKKQRKWYESITTRRRVLIGAAMVVLLAVIVIGVVAVSKRNSVKVDDTNRFNYSIVDQDVYFSGNRISNIFVRFGTYEEPITREYADYVFTPTDCFHVRYNGTYTATVEYKDKLTENYYFTISSLAQPITLTETNGMIQISVNNNYRVNFLYYIYGQSLGDPYARYMSLSADTIEVPALGNGVHTFRVNATTNLGDVGTNTYYVAIDVRSCTQPVVLVNDDSVGLYAYGFDITSVSYAKGTYGTWNEMKNIDGIYYTTCNTSLPRSDFEQGVYTFCFKSGGKEYLIQKNL